MAIPAGAETMLTGRGGVVATGIDIDGLRAIVGARASTDDPEPWRVLAESGVGDRLAAEFVLATRVEQHRAAGTLEVRTSEEPQPTVIAATDVALAAVGPPDDSRLLVDEDGVAVASVREALVERFEHGTPVELNQPGRSALIEAATELSGGFATDLEGALDGADRLRRGEDVDALTLLLVVGARNDLLFHEVRTWSEEAGVAGSQQFSTGKRSLEERGLIAVIKLPMGPGHPQSRLRIADEALADCDPVELVPTLRERYRATAAATDGRTGR